MFDRAMDRSRCEADRTLAPVVAGDRKGAHGRVRPSVLEADQTSGTASPRGSLACLLSQVSRRRVLLVFRHAASSTAGRLLHLEDSGEDHPAGKYVRTARSHKRAATPRSSCQTVLLYCPQTC